MEHENEMGIDLFRMLFKACLKWKIIVIVAVIVGFFIGAVKFAGEMAGIKDASSLEKTQNEYIIKKEAYDMEGRQLQNEIEEIRRNLQNQIQYNQSALKMKIDPHNEWIGRMNLYVDTDYQILPNMSVQNENPAYKIVYAYFDYVESGDFLKEMQSKVSYEIQDTKYLREIISADADGDRYALTFNVIADTESRCSELMEIARELLIEKQSDIEAQIGKHTIVIPDYEAYSGIDVNLEAYQMEQNAKEVGFRQVLAGYRMDYEEWESRESKIERPVLNVWDAVRIGVKFFVLSCIVALFIITILFCVGYGISAKIQGVESVPGTLHIIGEIPEVRKKRRNIIDQIIMSIFSVTVTAEDREARLSTCVRHMHQLIGAVDQGGKPKLAFVSDMPMTELQVIVKEIQAKAKEDFEAASAGNILVSTEGYEAAIASSAVVLVVKQGISVRNTLISMNDRLRGCNKTVLGVIVTNIEAR